MLPLAILFVCLFSSIARFVCLNFCPIFDASFCLPLVCLNAGRLDKSKSKSKCQVNASLGVFVCLLDLLDCLICLFEFIGSFSMLAFVSSYLFE